eukprot:s2362_g4.t1
MSSWAVFQLQQRRNRTVVVETLLPVLSGDNGAVACCVSRCTVVALQNSAFCRHLRRLRKALVSIHPLLLDMPFWMCIQAGPLKRIACIFGQEIWQVLSGLIQVYDTVWDLNFKRKPRIIFRSIFLRCFQGAKVLAIRFVQQGVHLDGICS